MYLLEIGKEHKPFLATIRHWSNIKIAFSDTSVWLKEFTEEQLKSANLLQIPHLTIYVVQENLLFLKGSLLPAKKVPSALLWAPIQKALPIELPDTNHNYFGIHEKIAITLTTSEVEREACGLLTDFESAKSYIETAPEIRLRALGWVFLEDSVLIMGTPLLPLQGTTFWRRHNLVLPTGFDLEFPILADVITKTIDPNSEHWIVWSEDNSYRLVPKESLHQLSISSLRLTI